MFRVPVVPEIEGIMLAGGLIIAGSGATQPVQIGCVFWGISDLAGMRQKRALYE